MRYSGKTFGFSLFVLLSYVNAENGKSLFDDLPLNGAYSPDDVSEVNPKLSADAKSTLSDSLFLVRSRKTKEKNSADLSADVDQSETESESKESPSLFDEMPNQGAMNVPAPSNDLNVSESNQRRSFVAPDLLIRSDAATNGLHYEIEKQEPAGEFHLSDFDRDLVPPIVQSLTRPHTVLSPIVQPPYGDTSGPLLLTHPVPKPYPSNTFEAIPVRSNSGRKSGNPASVIVYGSPAPALATQRERVTNKDVYHHYHFRAPPRSRPRNLEPPRVSEPASGYSNNQNRRTSFTGSSGGYGPSITTPQPPPQQTTTTTTQAPTESPTVFPIITYPDGIGGSVSVGGESTFADSVGEGDYDYDTLDFKPPHRRGQFSSRTGSGTITLGFGGGTRGGQRNSYNNEPQQQFSPPAETYGLPQPPPSYGPPAHEPPPPPPSYGPQLEFDPPVVEPPAPPPKNTGTTSISYQTIPIQTVHTQLVTVPHVTVSSSSDSQSDSSASSRPQRPGRPVSIAYGAPPATRSNSFSNTRDNTATTATESLFTDDQIAALLSVAGGGGGGNQFGEEDSLTTLLANSVRGGGNNLFGDRNILGGGDILGGRNILGGGDILGGNVLGGDLGLQLGGSRSILSQNRIRGNGNRDEQLLSALLNQQTLSDGFLSNRNPLAIPTRGFRNQQVLTGDAVDAVSDLIREQRLRGAIQDLSGRLRHQNRNAQRANEKYRSLFYKGALLLSALTLIPAVASPIAAAAASGASANSFLLPLASGRRKREAKVIDQYGSPFENCKWLSESGHNNGVGFNNWFNCALNATESMFQEESSSETQANHEIAIKLNPDTIRKDLQETVSPDEIRKNSECLQKRFCETVLEAEALSDAETLLLLYSIFGKDIENNHWIRGSITAARNKNCTTFFCFEDQNNRAENRS